MDVVGLSSQKSMRSLPMCDTVLSPCVDLSTQVESIFRQAIDSPTQARKGANKVCTMRLRRCLSSGAPCPKIQQGPPPIQPHGSPAARVCNSGRVPTDWAYTADPESRVHTAPPPVSPPVPSPVPRSPSPALPAGQRECNHRQYQLGSQFVLEAFPSEP